MSVHARWNIILQYCILQYKKQKKTIGTRVHSVHCVTAITTWWHPTWPVLGGAPFRYMPDLERRQEDRYNSMLPGYQVKNNATGTGTVHVYYTRTRVGMPYSSTRVPVRTRVLQCRYLQYRYSECTCTGGYCNMYTGTILEYVNSRERIVLEVSIFQYSIFHISIMCMP